MDLLNYNCFNILVYIMWMAGMTMALELEVGVLPHPGPIPYQVTTCSYRHTGWLVLLQPQRTTIYNLNGASANSAGTEMLTNSLVVLLYVI